MYVIKRVFFVLLFFIVFIHSTNLLTNIEKTFLYFVSLYYENYCISNIFVLCIPSGKDSLVKAELLTSRLHKGLR